MPQNPQQQGHILLEKQIGHNTSWSSFSADTVLIPNDNLGHASLQVPERFCRNVFFFLTFHVKHFPVRCQNHSQIIIGDTAPGFVFWLHHRLQLCFFWFSALGDSFSCPQLLIKLSSIQGITYVNSVSGRMFRFNRCLPTSAFLSSSQCISLLRGSQCLCSGTN